MLKPHEQQKLERIKAQIDAGEYDVPGEQIAGKRLSTEICPLHPGLEFPVWLDCPQCAAVNAEGRRVAHIREQRDFRQASAMEHDAQPATWFPLYGEVDPNEPEPTAQSDYAWDRWLIKAVAGVLLLVALLCIWMGAINRGLAEKYGQEPDTEEVR